MITIPKAPTGLATAGPDQDPGTVPQTGPDQGTDPDPEVTGKRDEDHGRGPGRPHGGPGTSQGRPGLRPVQDGRVERRKSGPTTSSSQPRQCLNTDDKTPTETGLVSTGKRSVAKGAKKGRGTGLHPARGQGHDQGQGRDGVATLQDHPTLQTAGAGAGAAVSVAALAVHRAGRSTVSVAP